MAAGVTDHVWTMEELLALVPEKPMGRVRRSVRSTLKLFGWSRCRVLNDGEIGAGLSRHERPHGISGHP